MLKPTSAILLLCLTLLSATIHVGECSSSTRNGDSRIDGNGNNNNNNNIGITLEYLGDVGSISNTTTFRTREILQRPILVHIEFSRSREIKNDDDGAFTTQGHFADQLFTDVSGMSKRSGNDKNNKISLDRFEAGSCGGRWQPKWGSASKLASHLANHIPCSQVALSMCLKETVPSSAKTSSSPLSTSALSVVGVKEAVCRTLGSALGNTLGLASSKKSNKQLPPSRSSSSTSHNNNNNSTILAAIRASAFLTAIVPKWAVWVLEMMMANNGDTNNNNGIGGGIMDGLLSTVGGSGVGWFRPKMSIPVYQPLHTWPIGISSTTTIIPTSQSPQQKEDDLEHQYQSLQHCFTEETSHEKLCTDSTEAYVQMFVQPAFHAHSSALERSLLMSSQRGGGRSVPKGSTTTVTFTSLGGGGETNKYDSDEQQQEEEVTRNSNSLKAAVYNKLQANSVFAPLLPPYEEAAVVYVDDDGSGQKKEEVVIAPSQSLLLAAALMPSHIAFLSSPFHSVRVVQRREVREGEEGDGQTHHQERVSFTYVLTRHAEVNEIRENVKTIIASGDIDGSKIEGDAAESILTESNGEEHKKVRHSSEGVEKSTSSSSSAVVVPAATTTCKTSTSMVTAGEVEGSYTFSTTCSVQSSSKGNDGGDTIVSLEVDELIVWPTYILIPFLHQRRTTMNNNNSNPSLSLRNYSSDIIFLHQQQQDNNNNNNNAHHTLTFALRHKLQVSLPPPSPPSLLAFTFTSTVPFQYPFLRIDQYSYDVNKAYILPPVTTRTVTTTTTSSRTEGVFDVVPKVGSDISHEDVLRYMFPPSDLLLGDSKTSSSEGAADIIVSIRYSRSATPTATTLPTADPAMVFNVLSLSTCVVAVCVGGLLTTIIRQRY